MRAVMVAATGVVLLAAGHAFAQGKPPAETVRYFQFTGDLMGSLTVEGFLKEVRQGARVASAMLDVCHSVAEDNDRKDRYVVALRSEGDKLVGRAESQEDKQPVTVSLTRKRAGKTVSFTGMITRGGAKFEVASTDNTDISEEEFNDSQAVDQTIAEAPANFADVAPDALGVQVKRDALAGLIKELRQQEVTVDLETLSPNCGELRSGQQAVHLTVNPDRAAAVVQKLKGVPGVSAAGWVAGTYAIDGAVRVQAAAWRSGADLDRVKLAAAVGAAAAKGFQATLESAAWDPRSGILSVKVKRPNRLVPQLGLTDRVEAKWLASAESPQAKDGLVLWLVDIAVRTLDEGPEPRLRLSDPKTGSGEEGEGSAVGTTEREGLVKAVAQALQGKLWDAEQSTWK